MSQAAPSPVAPELDEATGRELIVREGLVAGLLGYAIVALLVGLIDVVQGRSFFFTAAMLGEAVLYGLTDPARVQVWAGPVFAYNGLHLLGFLALGMLGAWLTGLAERGPHLWFLGVVLFLFVVAHAFGAVLLMTEPLRAAMSMWAVALPTLAAVVAMGLFLLRDHPALRARPGNWED